MRRLIVSLKRSIGRSGLTLVITHGVAAIESRAGVAMSQRSKAPPHGSVEIEPGFFEAPNGHVYMSQAEYDRREQEQRDADERHRASWCGQREQSLARRPCREDALAMARILSGQNDQLLGEIDRLEQELEQAQDRMSEWFLVLLDTATHYERRAA